MCPRATHGTHYTQQMVVKSKAQRARDTWLVWPLTVCSVPNVLLPGSAVFQSPHQVRGAPKASELLTDSGKEAHGWGLYLSFSVALRPTLGPMQRKTWSYRNEKPWERGGVFETQ